LQTAGTLARLQQRAVLGKGFVEEDDALQRGLDGSIKIVKTLGS
jgi:hypothetical protein